VPEGKGACVVPTIAVAQHAESVGKLRSAYPAMWRSRSRTSTRLMLGEDRRCRAPDAVQRAACGV